jgi:NAD+ kinase
VVVAKTAVAHRGGGAATLAGSRRQVARGLAPAASEHARTLETVLAALRRRGVEPRLMDVALDDADRATLAAARLVVTVGGDGTLLTASHHVPAATAPWESAAAPPALLGVNSAPRDSVGWFARARRATFAATLDAIAGGALRPMPVTRMGVVLDGVALAVPALNDVLVAHQHPAATSRYLVRRGRRFEEHRSSGLWIATAAGSTAGLRSAGGAVMPLRSRRLQFRARELYRRPGFTYALASGYLPPGATLVVESQMDAGWLWVDGSRTSHPFPFGARAELRATAAPLLLFADPRRWTAAARG